MKEMGYSSDQDGIIDRYLRENQNWKEHLENTKKFIIDAAETKRKNTAVVIGSGWWLDVPVESLSQMFSVVYLVDIRHPQQIRHKAKKTSNIQLIETDCSGFVEEVYNLVKNQKANASQPDLEKLMPTNFNFGLPSSISPDFIVSVNILNQLNILICDYLKRKMKYSAEELFSFAQRIQRVHLENLIPSKSCLITDYEELIYDESQIGCHVTYF